MSREHAPHISSRHTQSVFILCSNNQHSSFDKTCDYLSLYVEKQQHQFRLQFQRFVESLNWRESVKRFSVQPLDFIFKRLFLYKKYFQWILSEFFVCVFFLLSFICCNRTNKERKRQKNIHKYHHQSINQSKTIKFD